MLNFVERVKDIVVPPNLSRLDHAGRSLAAIGLATISFGFPLGVKNLVQGFEDDDAAISAQTFGEQANLYSKEATKDSDGLEDMGITGVGIFLAGAGVAISFRENGKRINRLEGLRRQTYGRRHPRG
jgi:hypothetical protein